MITCWLEWISHSELFVFLWLRIVAMIATNQPYNLQTMSEIKKLGIDIQLDEELAQGVYSNFAIISHSSSEFVLDFAATMPGVPKAKIKSRVVLAPEHAKRLLLSLQENITRYESALGRINLPSAPMKDDDPSQVTMGFSMGEA